MFHSDSRKSKNNSQIRKSIENSIPMEVKRLKIDHSVINGSDTEKSVMDLKTEQIDAESSVKPEKTEKDENPESPFKSSMNPIKTEIDLDELYVVPESLLKPLINPIKTEQEEGLLDPLFEPSVNINTIKPELDHVHCEYCHKDCDSSKGLSVHLTKAHPEQRTGGNESPHEIPDSLFEPSKKPDSLFEPSKKPVKTKPEELTCDHCQKVVGSSRSLTVHMTKVHSVQGIFPTFICKQCGSQFPTADGLESHTSSKHRTEKVKEKKKLVACPHCILKFERQSGLANHVTHVHKKKSELNFCTGCGLGFSSASKLMVHSVYEQKLVKIACEICQVNTEVKLNCEMEKMFKDSGSKVKCKGCTADGKQHAPSNKEKEHSSGHNSTNKNSEPKSHQNQLGSKIVMVRGEDESRDKLLRSKILVEQGEDGVVRYSCADCEYGTNHLTNIKNHVETKHLPPGKYPCQHCEKVCTTRNNLRSHISHKHKSRSISKATLEAAVLMHKSATYGSKTTNSISTKTNFH